MVSCSKGADPEKDAQDRRKLRDPLLMYVRMTNRE
jgi:hypothetical protein